jgi:hypothetical protein
MYYYITILPDSDADTDKTLSVVQRDSSNKNWAITPFGVLTRSGWGWGEDQSRVGVSEN